MISIVMEISPEFIQNRNLTGDNKFSQEQIRNALVEKAKSPVGSVARAEADKVIKDTRATFPYRKK